MPTNEEFLVGIYSPKAWRKTLSRWKKASLAGSLYLWIVFCVVVSMTLIRNSSPNGLPMVLPTRVKRTERAPSHIDISYMPRMSRKCFLRQIVTTTYRVLQKNYFCSLLESFCSGSLASMARGQLQGGTISLAREKNLLNIFPTNRCASIFSCRDWEIALLSWLYFHHLTVSIWRAFPSRDKTWQTSRAKNHNKRANPCNPYIGSQLQRAPLP